VTPIADVFCQQRTSRIPCGITLFSVVLSLLLVLVLSGEARADKSYKMESVAVVADLNADGSMTVVENRTYRFKGKFTAAFRTFPLTSGVSYTEFGVSENGEAYRLSDDKEPGSFVISNADDEVEVRWYYRARSETRTFTVSYVVHDVIVRHQDAAVLYYQFVGDDFRKSTESFEVVVNPPAPTEQWNVQQWAHGPLWGISSTSEDGVVTATCQNLPRRRFFELRILYPPEIFGDVAQLDGYIVDAVMAEESAWAEAANARREEAIENAATLEKRMKTGAWAMPLFLAMAVFWFIRIAQRYGKRPIVPTQTFDPSAVPSDLPPALVQYLIADRSITGNAIMGTMLDLARRGFLEFREEQELKKNFLGREKWEPSRYWLLKREYYQAHASDLARFEEMLIKFVFEELAADPVGDEDGVRVSTAAFKKRKSDVIRFFKEWSREVKQAGQECNFYDEKSIRGRNQGLLLGGVVLVAAALFALFFRQWALVPALGGVILVLSSLGIVHHGAEGHIQAKRWKSLKKYLTSRQLKQSEPSQVLKSIEPYFVYAAVLGLQKKHLAQLGDFIPTTGSHTYVPWYYYSNSGEGFSGESFATSFSASISAVNSAMSSSTGAGGGASGGGGGGAGGGGGGAS